MTEAFAVNDTAVNDMVSMISIAVNDTAHRCLLLSMDVVSDMENVLEKKMWQKCLRVEFLVLRNSTLGLSALQGRTKHKR